MEESEKRRERLRAMRLEATTDAVPSSFPQQTLNSILPAPLLNNEDSDAAAAAAVTPPPRFDYYTDPMAAYSTDKRRPFTPRPHVSPSPQGPRNPQMPHPGAPQFQHNVAAHQGIYQGGDPNYNPGWPGPTSSPIGIRSPYLMHQGSPNFGAAPGRGHWFNNNPSPGPPGTCGGSPYPLYQGSPNIRSPPQGRGHWSSNSPRPPSPGPGRGGGPSPNVGRGRGRWDGIRMSPSPGYSGGRGRGRSYDNGQARSFYNKSMVEDPWASLTPVIWQGEKENDVKSFTNNRGYFQKTPTFQKPPSAKKPRVSNPFDASNSKKSGSLADYLAESFNEDVEEESASIL
ncbi:uncharacterized protein LOC110709801 [Chenopodium quinoa]|uniref:uncharacterized protein LOC110709801 n=1 Tax=Chenopodium quinoa TaxID=63459 RepID=UPI000B781D35|nr:uncharacterized protein LOC110709801 [Chenopodium quinoa]